MIDAHQYVAHETLRNGTPVTIRAFRADDRERIAAAVRQLDRESIYTRLFSYRKELTEAGLDDPVLGTLPPRTQAFQWHSYTYELPDGAVELARSAVCTQAFRRDRAWGIQFHAEVTLSMIEAWAVEGADELPVPAGELVAMSSSRIDAWNENGRGLCGGRFGVAQRRAAERQPVGVVDEPIEDVP